jgi:hypothetical protein
MVTPEDRETHVRAVFEQFVLPVLEAKGNDYAGDNDVNSNFRIVAERLKRKKRNIDKYDVWAVLFEKHLMAIETWLRDREVKSEPIHMRIVDAINYLIILWSMASEEGLMPKAQDYSSSLISTGTT